ncbi:hypothetical protein [Actinoallomurus sp. CA-142502]|uniref:hypothetical protein n=1 Tax=Actinoallomurus sp. CA-142502 TaxID=3239885 RepID=UPI003D931F62
MAAALAEIAHVLGIDPARETEPGLTPHPMTPERAADFRHFVEHDFDALLADTFDPRSALGTGVRVVPAVGRTTPGAVFGRRCAEEPAKALGTEPAEFPGGHNGDLSHPSAYAARLREVLEPSRTTV